MKTTILAALFEVTPRAITNWKKERKPAISLIERYFTEREIEEFLSNGKISKQDKIKKLDIEEIDNAVRRGFVDIHVFKLKLISMPNAAKQLLEDQLQFCIDTKKDFTIEIAKNYYKSHFQKFTEEFKNLFVFRKPDPDYSSSTRNKFAYFIQNILNKDEIQYINQNKEEIIELLDNFKGLIANSTW